MSTRIKWWFLGIVSSIPGSILIALNICPYCFHHSITVGKRPTRTAYVEKDLNWETSCIDCYEEHDAEWEARWAEYYRGCL